MGAQDPGPPDGSGASPAPGERVPDSTPSIRADIDLEDLGTSGDEFLGFLEAVGALGDAIEGGRAMRVESNAARGGGRP